MHLVNISKKATYSITPAAAPRHAARPRLEVSDNRRGEKITDAPRDVADPAAMTKKKARGADVARLEEVIRSAVCGINGYGSVKIAWKEGERSTIYVIYFSKTNV